MGSTLNKLLKRLRRNPNYRKMSDKPTAQKMIATLYNPFAIPNVNGNLLTSIVWTTRLVDPPKLGNDSAGKFRIETLSDAPLYVVGKGTDRDFRILSQDSGFVVGENNAIRVSSKLVSEGGTKASIVVLEYDEERNRIGELSISPSAKVRGTLLADTRYVLPTIRIAGKGSVTVESLTLDLIKSESTLPKSAGRIEVLQPNDLAITDGKVAAIKQELDNLKSTVERVDSELSEYLLDGGPRSDTNATASARGGSQVSISREKTARELLVQMAKSLPGSDGSHHFQKISMVAGLITDEYMFNFYKDVFEEAVYLSPDNYRETLTEKSLDVIIYVTCWKGMEGEEWKGVKFREKPMRALEDILAYANSEGKTTIFQSIEDPSNFEYFLPIAEKFDWVFTSDVDMVDSYKRELGHTRVAYGEYGANPIINNPIGSYRFNLNKAFFAGSYPERYPERCADMRQIFSSIPDQDSNLVILDRNFHGDGYEFPEEFQASILGPVPHAELQKIHKLFRVSLNFNSIKGSPTMCAMRVYELQAQGKPVISNYARSVFNRFPGIRIVASDTELTELIEPDPYYEELEGANALMTQLFTEKSSFDVVSDMLRLAGLPGATQRDERILVIADNDVEGVRRVAESQWGVSVVVAEIDAIRSGAINISEFGYITAMSSDIEYERTYLRSRQNVFVYTEALFATQEAFFGHGELSSGEIHEFVKVTSDRYVTMASTEHPDALEFFLGERTTLEGKGYAADPFGIGYSSYLSESLRPEIAPTPVLSVIIPVYNNGEFLATKCIPSLRRNGLWGKMQIVLVDDGSTDSRTIDICEDLKNRYQNIKLYSYGDGGSGSASRPRNKGIELAEAELVTFLDPDNEISPHGYDNLVGTYQSLAEQGKGVDLVSGYQVKIGESVSFTGRHASGDVRIVDSGKREFFDLGKFPVVSTQASVIRKSLLIEERITFVEKAAGQDTLYGWEVLGKASRSAFVDSAYILYFAEREGSVTNVLDPQYFWKCLELEKVQVPVLKGMEIFDAYKTGQFDFFMRNWYLKKFSQVSESQKDEARAALNQIADLYEVELTDYMN